MEAKNIINCDTTDILHHVGLINSSLEVSAAQFEKLGFTLTPLSVPKIPLTPGGSPETLGAGNRHAIFEHNYLELLGVVDPARWAEVTKEQRGPYDLDAPLSRYEGLHVMHFGTDHIEEVKMRLDKLGIPVSPIKAFQRNVQTPDGEKVMKARTLHFVPGSNPEGLLQIAQHDTPELIFQKRYMHHRNGAKALTEIIVVAEEPAVYAAKYEQYSGHQSHLTGNGQYSVDLGFSKITIVNPAQLDAIVPGCRIPVLPFLAAFTIKSISLQSVCNVLTNAKIPFTERRGAIIVYPENACGSAIIFEED